MEHSIEQKRMSKPGYEDAYLQIWGTCEELGLVLCEEGEEKYPGDSKEKENYMNEKWDQIMIDLRLELRDNL